ncbi:hypothetical protein BC832DRAFT_591302 [Gaertneriomyces semiglobifer]|nr:hypothetical protein BC832DRAFT_591302 [Gaertneriomyces semiglobifer]
MALKLIHLLVMALCALSMLAQPASAQDPAELLRQPQFASAIFALANRIVSASLHNTKGGFTPTTRSTTAAATPTPPPRQRRSVEDEL